MHFPLILLFVTVLVFFELYKDGFIYYQEMNAFLHIPFMQYSLISSKFVINQ